MATPDLLDTHAARELINAHKKDPTSSEATALLLSYETDECSIVMRNAHVMLFTYKCTLFEESRSSLYLRFEPYLARMIQLLTFPQTFLETCMRGLMYRCIVDNSADNDNEELDAPLAILSFLEDNRSCKTWITKLLPDVYPHASWLPTHNPIDLVHWILPDTTVVNRCLSLPRRRHNRNDLHDFLLKSLDFILIHSFESYRVTELSLSHNQILLLPPACQKKLRKCGGHYARRYYLSCLVDSSVPNFFINNIIAVLQKIRHTFPKSSLEPRVDQWLDLVLHSIEDKPSTLHFVIRELKQAFGLTLGDLV
jgi:hypothetical protein